MFASKTNILKAVIYALVLAVLLKIELVTVPGVSAAGSFSIGSGTPVHGSLGDDLVNFIGKIALINTFMHIMLLIVLQFLGYLLQADFFNDPAMMSALNNIWQLSRDIMNVIFALMLIGVSFLVIITGKTDKAKEKIVNFVVAVILVNFSWFFPRVILDIANVLTATVYTIPQALGGFNCMTLDELNNPVECRVITDVLVFPSAAESAGGGFAPGGFCVGSTTSACSCSDNIECHKTDTFSNSLTTMTSAHAMLNGMAVSFARITVLNKIPTSVIVPSGGGLTANQAVRVSFNIAMSIMLAFAIQLAVLLPLLGLAVGLFIRIIILWITTAFMPFSFLGYVINGKLGTNIFEFETDIWKEFINAAFLPAMVAIPFVIGFIMLSAVSQIPAPPGMFSLTIGVPILSGVRTWWQLIWTMAAIGIIWTGAFKALSRSQIIGKFTDKIKGFGEQVFGGIAQAPLLIPLPLPGGNKSGMNLGTLVHGPKIVADSVRMAASGTSGKSFGDIVAQRFGGAAAGGATAADTAASTEFLRQNRNNASEIVNAIKALNNPALTGTARDAEFAKIRDKLGTQAQGLNNSETANLLKEMVKIKNPNSELKAIEVDITNLKA
ncbi:MAG: hypothetical protein KBA40_01055 [Candidatus Peribacteraceae bacterium]|nr:hypothetical protein [Candidatus Peribacteraceae bacterium]